MTIWRKHEYDPRPTKIGERISVRHFWSCCQNKKSLIGDNALIDRGGWLMELRLPQNFPMLFVDKVLSNSDPDTYWEMHQDNNGGGFDEILLPFSPFSKQGNNTTPVVPYSFTVSSLSSEVVVLSLSSI